MKIKSSLEITPILEKILYCNSGLKHPLNTASKEVRQLAEDVKIISNEYIFCDSLVKKEIFKKKNLAKAYQAYYLPVTQDQRERRNLILTGPIGSFNSSQCVLGEKLIRSICSFKRGSKSSGCRSSIDRRLKSRICRIRLVAW